MEQQQISVQELMMIIGDKECQLIIVRTREQALLKTLELQKLKIAELEKQLTSTAAQ